MDLPIQFPSETEVILEDVARFRALTPAERIRSVRGHLAAGIRLMGLSTKKAWIYQDFEERQSIEHNNIKEFIERHGS